MAVKFETVENIPTWATCWLMYGEDDGLTSVDIAEVSAYVLKLAAAGLRMVCPIDGTENGFCRRPAFGTACDTVAYYAELTAAARAVRAFVRSSRAYRPGDFDRMAAARIWNGGRGRLEFVRVVPFDNGGGRVYVNMSVYRRADGGRVSALLADLAAADGAGARWRVVPVFLGYPAFYDVRTLGPSGCMTPAPRELVAKLCAAVGAENVEMVSVNCGLFQFTPLV